MKKKLILLALALVMCGCAQKVHDCGVVTKVEVYEVSFKTGLKTKYRITVDDFNAGIYISTYVYTNTKYSVGDTIQITKKN